ncbi:MAG TPA: tryptophan 7-halogenase, partial [Anaerolineales bacterium]|nr:tryptophan 7-halogenase [Anaerolineales bacterium]
GGGPGGTAAAMYLIREGIKPVIIEKDPFPRYHIGESMTGECGGVVRDLGLTEEMLKRRYPVKHGVKVYGKNPWFLPVMARDPQNNLMDMTTWQVRRSDFDQMMLQEAIARGATLVEGQAVEPIVDDDDAVKGVIVRMADGGTQRIESELLIDASGQATFLAVKGVTGPKYLGNYDRQLAVFSQIEGGIRDAGETRDMQPDNTLIFYKEKYHWAWWIPLDEQVVSVGVVTPAAYFMDQRESKHDFLTRELHTIHPDLTRRIPEIRLVEESRAIKNYSYQVKRFTGKGFLCLGDSHRFIDPIFSFGLYVTMKEAQIAAPLICEYLNGRGRDSDHPFEDYEIYVEKGIDVLEDTLDGFWEHPFAFAMLVYNRYVDQMIDIFAGRIYDGQPSEAALAFRSLLKRERSYDSGGDYSMPIGSRYDPERAPIWVEDSSDMEELSRILVMD